MANEENNEQAQAPEEKPSTDDVLDAGPQFDENDPEFALNQALEADEPQEHEDDATREGIPEEESVADVQADEQRDEEGTEAQTESEAEDEEAVDPDEQIAITRDEYERLMEMMGMDEEDAPVTPESAPEEKKAEEKAEEPAKQETPQPVTAENFKLPETDDELVDLLSSPEAYNKHVSSLLESAVTTTLQAVEPMIAERSMNAYAAARFQEKFFEEHPHLVKRPQFVTKALAAAQRKLGPNASWDELYAETDKNCAFADRVAAQVKNTGGRTKKAGRYSPKATRKSRPTSQPKKASPTEEAFEEMNQISYDQQTAQLLRDVGAL